MKLIGPPGTELRHILATYIMCSCDLDLWPISQKLGHVTPRSCWMYVPMLKFIDILVLEIFDLKNADLVSPLLGNRRCHCNHFLLHSLGGGLPHVSFQVWTWYDHPVLSYYNFYLNTLRYVVTLTFDLLALESCHVMPLWWSIRVPSLNMIWLTVPELKRLQFSIDRQLKVPIFTFLVVMGVKFQI